MEALKSPIYTINDEKSNTTFDDVINHINANIAEEELVPVLA